MGKQDNPFEDSKVANEWIEWVESSTPSGSRHSQIYPLIKNWLAIISPRTIADIGSGQGVVSEYINSRKAEYIGVDPSITLIKRAKELYGDKSKKFIVGNAYALPIKDAWADAAISVYVWMHLENIDKASRELARIMRPGGNFLIITANPGAYDIWKSFYSNVTAEGDKIEGSVSINDNSLSRNNIYLHTRKEIERELINSGLTIDKVEVLWGNNQHEDDGIHISLEGTKK